MMIDTENRTQEKEIDWYLATCMKTTLLKCDSRDESLLYLLTLFQLYLQLITILKKPTLLKIMLTRTVILESMLSGSNFKLLSRGWENRR